MVHRGSVCKPRNFIRRSNTSGSFDGIHVADDSCRSGVFGNNSRSRVFDNNGRGDRVGSIFSVVERAYVLCSVRGGVIRRVGESSLSSGFTTIPRAGRR